MHLPMRTTGMARRLWRSVAGEPEPVRFWRENGYFVFRNALPPELIEQVRAAIDTEVVNRETPLPRHHGPPALNEIFIDREGRRSIRNALLDPHMAGAAIPRTAGAVVQLIAAGGIERCLACILPVEPRNYAVHQTILFFQSAGSDVHIDGWGWDTLPRGGAMTMWIPLEGVNADNGPLAIVPWKLGRGLSQDDLGICRDCSYEQYHDALVNFLRREERVVPHFSPGDFVVFSSLTPHGTMPRRHENASRRSMQVIVRPMHLPWSIWSGPPLTASRAPVRDSRPRVAPLVRAGKVDRSFVRIGKRWYARMV